jgi:pimeloyl-ACP methyl ester carboxylesterase
MLWGDSDPCFAVADGERVADAIPDADLWAVTDTGHVVPDECPDEMAAAVGAFLSG